MRPRDLSSKSGFSSGGDPRLCLFLADSEGAGQVSPPSHFAAGGLLTDAPEINRHRTPESFGP